jgi:hypothetical protein
MPRTRKPAGTAVDRRNGRQLEVEAHHLGEFPLPVRSADARTRQVWAALWGDPVSSALSLVDRELVVRWITSVDRWIKALASADASPIATGSMGQEVPSPWFAIAKQHLDVAERCEQQLGVGALNRARLGISIVAARRSLEDLNAEIGEVGDEPDPRLS